MEIIKPGKYPEKNVVTCDKCECEFKYHDSEVNIISTTPDESSFLGGFGVHKYVECPTCKHKVTIECTFIEDNNWIDSLMNGIKKLFGLNKEEKNEK